MSTYTAIINVTYTACENTDPSDKADTIVRDLQNFLGFDVCLDDILEHEDQEEVTHKETSCCSGWAPPTLHLYKVWSQLLETPVWLMSNSEENAVAAFHVIRGKQHRYDAQIFVVQVQTGDVCV